MEEYDLDTLWEEVRLIDEQKRIATSSSACPKGDFFPSHAYNLKYCHFYAAVHTYELSTGERLIKMRDPEASHNYSGMW
jgi:hypothetical protein